MNCWNKENLEKVPGGSSQGTLWTLLASWFRDHHKGGPRLKPSQELREREFWKTALVKAWLGWEFLRKTLKEGQGLFTPWPWCYWRGGHPKLVPALTPCYYCNPIDSQNLEKRKSLAYFACRRTRSCSILALPLKIWLLWYTQGLDERFCYDDHCRVWFIPQRQFCLPKMAHLALRFSVWLHSSKTDFSPI